MTAAAPVRDAPFELLGGHLALDFANTLDNRYAGEGPVELLPSYARVVAFAEQAGALKPRDARRLRRDTSASDGARVQQRAVALREAIYALCLVAAHGEPPAPGALRILNTVLAEAPRGRILEWDGERYVWRAVEAPVCAETPLISIAEAAAALLSSDEISHIRECGSPTCRWLFLDRSRNHSRRWCDMATCGNRAKARRHRDRE